MFWRILHSDWVYEKLQYNSDVSDRPQNLSQTNSYENHWFALGVTGTLCTYWEFSKTYQLELYLNKCTDIPTFCIYPGALRGLSQNLNSIMKERKEVRMTWVSVTAASHFLFWEFLRFYPILFRIKWCLNHSDHRPSQGSAKWFALYPCIEMKKSDLTRFFSD